MQRYTAHTPWGYILALGALLSCQACSPSVGVASAPGFSLTEAYNQSGTVSIPPYTRSIISSNNF